MHCGTCDCCYFFLILLFVVTTQMVATMCRDSTRSRSCDQAQGQLLEHQRWAKNLIIINQQPNNEHLRRSNTCSRPSSDDDEEPSFTGARRTYNSDSEEVRVQQSSGTINSSSSDDPFQFQLQEESIGLRISACAPAEETETAANTQRSCACTKY